MFFGLIKRSLQLSLLCAAISAGALYGSDFFGRVVSVLAGDHLTVMHDGLPLRVRLFGITCPTGARGIQARKFVHQMAGSRGVHVQIVGLDKKGRPVARVNFLGGRSLNEELVRVGLARWSKLDAPHEKILARLEAEARAARRGLWADPQPVKPSDRRKRRGA